MKKVLFKKLYNLYVDICAYSIASLIVFVGLLGIHEFFELIKMYIIY